MKYKTARLLDQGAVKMSWSPLKHKGIIISGLAFLFILTSLCYAQTFVMDRATSIAETIPIAKQNDYLYPPFVGPSDGSLGAFYPTQDLALDSAYPLWNGKLVQLNKQVESNRIGAVFNVTNVFIPAGVRLSVTNYDYVIFNAIGDIIIEGYIEANGSSLIFITNQGSIAVPGGVSANGQVGERGQNGPPDISPTPQPGGQGGTGGNGGQYSNNPQGGAGLGGGGGAGAPAGQSGAPGLGPLDSPGQAQRVTIGTQPRPTGGGSAGGSNGTKGARGLGRYINGYYISPDAFGFPNINLDPFFPAGGGSGAAGGDGIRVCTVSGCPPGSQVGQGTGGGGGGGGGAGSLILYQASDNVILMGSTTATGGKGGDGGNGARNTRYPYPGAEGGDGGGGGGGGAGGFILIKGKSVTLGVGATLEAKGGSEGVGGLPGSPIGVSYAGFPGGPGGGGRIAIFATNGISGFTANDGMDATPPTLNAAGTPGEPTMFLGVQLDSITFNFDTTDTTDGLNIRIDETTTIPTPEWVVTTREKAPTQMPYMPDTAAPAAYKASNPLKLQARFSTRGNLATATIKAALSFVGGGASPFGDLLPQMVTFTGGDSGQVTFTSEFAAGKITADDVVFDWEVVSGTTASGQEVGRFDINQTTHRIYTVLALPVAPQTEAWAKVLELSCGMAAGLKAPDAMSVAQALAEGLFYSRWRDFVENIRFFRPVGSYQYDPSVLVSCGTLGTQRYPLQRVLTDITTSPLVMQCNDNSNLHAILSASQGIVARPTYLDDTVIDPSPTGPRLAPAAPYTPAGLDTTCVVQTDALETRFTFHQVGSFAELIYDTSVRCPPDGVTCSVPASCTPRGSNFFGLTFPSYLGRVFPTQPLARTVTMPITVTIGSCP